MDFLEDYQIYDEAMQNAYAIITRRKTLDDIYNDFEKEGRNTGKLLLNVVGGVFFLIVAMAIYKKL